MQSSFDKAIAASPIVPILTIEHEAHAVPFIERLIQEGLTVFEVTLRTPAALDAVCAIKEAMPEAVVGVGTVLDPKQYERVAAQVDVDFFVSPGITPAMLELASQSQKTPFFLGVSTTSELMQALEFGLNRFKFFPAYGKRGLFMLDEWNAIFPAAQFFATGGIDPEKAPLYLQKPNVFAVGRLWREAEQKKELRAR